MLPILFISLSVVRPSYCSSSSGVEWKQEWVENVRSRIEFLWSKRGVKQIAGQFNIDTGDEDMSKYVYDPLRKTVDPPL